MTAPSAAAPSEQPDRDQPETVELRVHGVHNTSPASMLGLDPLDVGQVAGDGLTGVYRARPGVDLPFRDTDELAEHRVSVEAYSWGALTSGVRGALGWVKRALWLLLLPFALANLAYWARLRMAEDSGTARWGARATRLGALLLTVFMVLTPCLLGVDLVAWQCYRGGSPGCSLPGRLDFMARMWPAQRLAMGSLVPLAVVGVLWALSRTTMMRYEESTTRLTPATTGGVLRHPKLWEGATRTRQLQRVHLTVALGVIVAFSGLHVLAVDPARPVRVWLTLGAAVVLTATATGWAMVIHPDDIDFFRLHTSRVVAWRRRAFPATWQQAGREKLPEWLLWAAVGVTALHLLGLLTLTDALVETGDFTGHNMWFITVFVTLTAVHLSIFTGGRMPTRRAIAVVIAVFALGLLALAIHLQPDWLPDGALPEVAGGLVLLVLWGALAGWHYRQGRVHTAEAWNGAGASVLLAAAAWVALLFTTAIVTAGADYLNGTSHAVDDLVSHSSVKARQAAEAYPLDPRSPDDYVAAGDVTAEHAIVHVVDGELVVVSGEVRMESLYQPSEERTGPLADLARALDSTRIASGTVDLPTPALALADSCVRRTDSTDATCSAEDGDFVVAGTLPLPGQQLRIQAAGGKVTLQVDKPPASPLVIPQVLIWTPLIQLTWLIVVVGYAVGAVLRFRRAQPAVDALLGRDLDIAQRDHAAAGKKRLRAAFLHRAERLLDGIGAITAVLALALIALSAIGRPPWDVWAWTSNIATLAMYVVALLALALLFLASRIRTSESARKGVGVLWDLTTFWPRAAHPLAPPCYAERVVPELRTRLNWALRQSPLPGARPRNLVVLSGHSQGSAIVTALLSRLSRAELSRIRVITYGSQIRALYGRIFPRVFGPDEIGYVPTPGPSLLGDAFPDAYPTEQAPSPYVVPQQDDALGDDEWADRPLMARVFLAGGDWANLFRRTDGLGFRVFSDVDQEPDHYVPEVPERGLGDPGPEVMSHSGYQHSPVYRQVLAGWTHERVVEEPEGTLGLPVLPPP